MLGKIIGIEENKVLVKLDINIYEIANIIGKNVIFVEGENKIIGEITNINNGIATITLVGEIVNNNFIYGDINKPSFASSVKLITNEELDIIFRNNNNNSIILGNSFVYRNYQIKLDINTFFSNHFAILGNTGSGKSYSVAKIIQSIFYQANKLPYRTNIFLFDAYGEYQRAFNNIGDYNENINYKVYTTNVKSTTNEIVKIPFWLLGVDDIALLLNANNQAQIPIIEKALKLVAYFAKNEETVIKQKNDIIARCLLDTIFALDQPHEVRNKVISILSKFHTKDLNLELPLVKDGWSRTLRQCLYIDEHGKIADIESVITYLESLIGDDFELTFPDGSFSYTLNDFATALEFALVSEGTLNSDHIYDYANILKVRLNTIINSEYATYFDFPTYINRENYIKWLLTTNEGRKVQVINFNINYVDDRFAKTLVKIYSKLLFDYIVTLKKRASLPFHIVLEEAHRYVQNDTDTNVIGYNIFDRITKEGRKYGLILGLISQRPSEISETAISQCSNFLIFKMFHPKDLTFINAIIPNAEGSIISKLKTLHPGTCMIFGNAFRMPVLVTLDKPNPEPMSSNADINKSWYIDQ